MNIWRDGINIMDINEFSESELKTIVDNFNLAIKQVEFNARMFGIDYSEYETNKRSILEKIRNRNGR